MQRVTSLSLQVQTRGRQEEFHEFITRIVRCFLQEAGCPSSDPELLRECFIRFQDAVTPMKQHLAGIKKQNTWIMRQAA